MKANILLENLQKKLLLVNKAVSSRSQLPILLNFLVETKEGQLFFSATDLEIGIQIAIPANIEEEGGVTIPAKTFIELINSLPSGKVTLETKENTIIITTVKTKSILQTLPREEFPKLYETKGEEIVRIKREVLQKEFAKVIFAASTDVGRPALSGVLLKREKDSILTVGTDGYRLSLKQHPVVLGKNDYEEHKPLVIPARVLREIVMAKEDAGETGIFITKESNQVLFEQDTEIIVGRLIDAEYPAYERIIPTSFSTQCTFDREEMQKAVKLSAIFAREAANIIKFIIKKDGITVSANTPSVGENTVSVEAKVSGEENEIAFNARYLLELFSNVNEAEMVFEMTGALAPGVFKIKDDPSFLHLVMPIRVQ